MSEELKRASALWIIFDGPPSNESGRFIEVEDESGRGCDGPVWEEADGKYWRLGPFALTSDCDALRAENERLRKVVEAAKKVRGRFGFIQSAMRCGEPLEPGHCGACSMIFDDYDAYDAALAALDAK